MTFSQKYNELLLSHSAKIDENLYRMKLDAAIVSLRTGAAGYYGVVMNFLEEYAEAMLDEIVYLDGLVDENDESYQEEEKELRDYIDKLLDDNIESKKKIKNLEIKIDLLKEEIIGKDTEIAELNESVAKITADCFEYNKEREKMCDIITRLELKLIDKDKEIQGYIDDITWIETQEGNN